MSKYGYRRRKYSIESGCSLLLVMIILSGYFGNGFILEILKNFLSILLPILFILIGIIILLVIYRRSKFPNDKFLNSSQPETVPTSETLPITTISEEDELYTEEGMSDIDNMSGTDFEERLIKLFQHLGYQVKHTGRTGDFGVDLIIEKGGEKTAVQAKRWSNNVGEKAVQEVYTGKDYYQCDGAIIVTNSKFTPAAWKVARATNVKLWSRNYLKKVLDTEHEKLHGHSTTKTVSNLDEQKQGLNSMQKTPKQNQDYSELFTYISHYLSLGRKWTDLKIKLLQVGWKEDVLNDVFFQVYNPETSKFIGQQPNHS